MAALVVRGAQLVGVLAVLCSVVVAAASAIELDVNPVARPVLKPALRDPFLMPVPASLKVPVQVPVSAFTALAPVQAAPIMPSAPSAQLSFMGRIQTPDGRSLVLAQWSDGGTVSLEQGKLLANGFRVERLSSSVVELLHSQTQAVVQVQLPPVPRFETR